MTRHIFSQVGTKRCLPYELLFELSETGIFRSTTPKDHGEYRGFSVHSTREGIQFNIAQVLHPFDPNAQTQATRLEFVVPYKHLLNLIDQLTPKEEQCDKGYPED